jgi:hypothetical protein
MKVAFATCAAPPAGWHDDQEVARLLGAEFVVGDDPAVDWEAYDRVILRSVWDYSRRAEEFLAWCAAVGPGRLRNRPDLVAFDADKRYLGELRAPTAPTTFVAAGDPPPELAGEVVVKPNVSTGARDTGRFGPAAHAEAPALVERIRASGRVAIVQAYLADVDRGGETALVFLAEVSGRFGTPLYARVDIAADADGRPAGADGARGDRALPLLRDQSRRGGALRPRRAHRPLRAEPGEARPGGTPRRDRR